MRWIIRIVVLGLAGFGAYRLYELATAKATEVKENVAPPIGDAVDTVKYVASQVKDDITMGKDDVVDDLAPLISSGHEPRMAVGGDRLNPAGELDPVAEQA